MPRSPKRPTRAATSRSPRVELLEDRHLLSGVGPSSAAPSPLPAGAPVSSTAVSGVSSPAPAAHTSGPSATAPPPRWSDPGAWPAVGAAPMPSWQAVSGGPRDWAPSWGAPDRASDPSPFRLADAGPLAPPDSGRMYGTAPDFHVDHWWDGGSGGPAGGIMAQREASAPAAPELAFGPPWSPAPAYVILVTQTGAAAGGLSSDPVQVMNVSPAPSGLRGGGSAWSNPGPSDGPDPFGPTGWGGDPARPGASPDGRGLHASDSGPPLLAVLANSSRVVAGPPALAVGPGAAGAPAAGAGTVTGPGASAPSVPAQALQVTSLALPPAAGGFINAVRLAAVPGAVPVLSTTAAVKAAALVSDFAPGLPVNGLPPAEALRAVWQAVRASMSAPPPGTDPGAIPATAGLGETLLARGADLLASFSPFDREALDRAFDDLLDHLSAADADLPGLATSAHLIPRLVAAGAAVVLAESLRRRLRLRAGWDEGHDEAEWAEAEASRPRGRPGPPLGWGLEES